MTTRQRRSIRRASLILIIGSIAATLACDREPAPAAQQSADTIYTEGDIVTVNDAQPTAEALAVKDGKILTVGARADVERAHKGTRTRAVDLRAGPSYLGSWTATHTCFSSGLRPLAPTCWRRQTVRRATSTTSS